MKKQILSVAIALPTVLLGAVPSLANTLTTALVKADTPQSVAKASCSLSSGCSKKSNLQKVGSQPTPTPTPTNPPEPPCPLPRRC